MVLNGGPSFNEGNTWRGQPGQGTVYNISRFPAWEYGIAYPVTAASCTNNYHNNPASGGSAYLCGRQLTAPYRFVGVWHALFKTHGVALSRA